MPLSFQVASFCPFSKSSHNFSPRCLGADSHFLAKKDAKVAKLHIPPQSLDANSHFFANPFCDAMMRLEVAATCHGLTNQLRFAHISNPFYDAPPVALYPIFRILSAM